MTNRTPILRIDKRDAQDIKNSIKDLSSKYVSEWQFDEDNPDIGTALGMVFASEMEMNIDRYNQVIGRYHTEFVNMLDISLLPAKPSKSIVVLETPQSSMPGRSIRRGTKFTGSDPESEEAYLIFESDHDIYVSSSALTDVFMTDTDTGGIIPLKGDFKRQEILPASFFETDPYEDDKDADTSIKNIMDNMALIAGSAEGISQADGQRKDSDEERERLKPFKLFGGGEGIEDNVLLFEHPVIFDVTDNPIYVRIKGCKALVKDIQEGKFSFLYPTESALRPYDSAELMEDGETFCLKRKHPEKKTGTDENASSLMVLKANGHVLENYHVESITFSSAGEPKPPQTVCSETTDLNPKRFNPFSDTLSLFQECYIGHDEYFSKAGSRIRLEFDIEYFEHRVNLTPQEEDVQLKVIKKIPAHVASDTVADAHAEEITIEYFNGSGWKRLPLKGGEYRTMFAVDRKGKYRIAFDCPDDWKPYSQGAYEGRCLRFVLLKSDNCYMRPCIHHYPRISDLKISFSYRDNYVYAAKTQAITGTRRLDLSRASRMVQGYDAFYPSIYGEDALYLGFARRLEEGPIGLLFMVEESVRYEDVPITFEYSTSRGFKRLRVVDNTEDLSKSGTVMFMPPSDMMAVPLEDKRLYWIRITRRKSRGPQQGKELLPVIKDIRPNAVLVSNINTLPEENFYLEEVMPFPKFALGATNILDVILWVNEMGRHPRDVMKQMLMDDPDNIRAEYGTSGEISAFYVRWKETDSLSGDESKRCYLLDRMNNVITFGDGIHTDIPRVTDNVAFKVTVRTCSGKKGNVPPYNITEAMQDLSYIDVDGNPIHAYGGSNIEDLDSALKRGANILCARRRLVSSNDYVNEILAFSDTIAKASCIPYEMVDGTTDTMSMTFVVLLQDHDMGSFAFHDLARKLENHLIEQCECTVSREHIHIIEPVFVDISVDVWAHSDSMEDSFQLQEKLREAMDKYLDPVNAMGGDGHEIGALPSISQIIMHISGLKEAISVANCMITARYTDTTGTHEVDYRDFKATPFMVCRSGTHRIHLILE